MERYIIKQSYIIQLICSLWKLDWRKKRNLIFISTKLGHFNSNLSPTTTKYVWYVLFCVCIIRVIQVHGSGNWCEFPQYSEKKFHLVLMKITFYLQHVSHNDLFEDFPRRRTGNCEMITMILQKPNFFQNLPHAGNGEKLRTFEMS